MFQVLTSSDRRYSARIVAALVIAVLSIGPAASQTTPARRITPEQMVAFEAALDISRKANGVPGAAVVIVQGTEVMLLKGLGVASTETAAVITPDTMFQIASASKAFTALSVLMLVDDGKLKLEDKPQKYLPDFRISDPSIDANITVRDLLTHTSGFPRTDVAWIMGTNLTREDLIKGIAQLKPTAKLGQRFQYQNLMYVAAGEVVGAADKTSFERVLHERIFNPLGMRDTNVRSELAARSLNRATGYSVAAKKAPTPMAAIDPEVINAAGGINSTARDLAQWLKFLVARGEIDGRRLLKLETFKTFVEPVTPIGQNQSYALGWFVNRIGKTTLIEHGGNLPGFTSQVAFIPELDIGIAVLSNVDTSAFPAEAMQLALRVFTGGAAIEAVAPATETPAPQAAADLQKEVGIYAAGGPGQDISVALADGQLVMTVPGQTPYPLAPLGNRRYKLEGATSGFFATFQPVAHEATWSELSLQQPQGNLVFPKRQRVPLAEAHLAAAEALGVFNFKRQTKTVRLEIDSMAGLPALIMAGQSALALITTGKDTFEVRGLAGALGSLTLKHGDDGFVSGFTLRQGANVIEATGPLVIAADITLEGLAAKVLAAAGGADRLVAIKTARIETEKALVGNGQGLIEYGTMHVTAGTWICSDTDTFAFGKPTSTSRAVATRTGGFTQQNTDASEVIDPQLRAVVFADAHFDEPARWATAYKSVKLKGIARRAVGRVYLVEKLHSSGASFTDAYDAESFRLLEQTSYFGAKGSRTRMVQRFSDYRDVDGISYPFTTSYTLAGAPKETLKIKKIVFNVAIDPAVCQPKTK
jgi:CubicO group peptidase (beta-lactamase class C family)